MNMEVIDLARANGVVLLCLPPHCSHKMQPLNVSFMKPLSIYYDQELEKWLCNHPGRVVTTFQVAKLFRIAYTKAATAQTAINGFKKTGLFPTNRDIFEPHDFAPCQPTNIDSGKNDQLNESAFVTEILIDLPSNKFADKSDSQSLTLMQTPQSQPISTQEATKLVVKTKQWNVIQMLAIPTLLLHRRTYYHMQLHLLQKHLQDLVESQKHDVDLLLF